MPWLFIACTGVREELGFLLSTVEKALKSRGLTWGNALYIRLFLDDMASFGTANGEYVTHITEQKCERGVASRCCMEVCLPEAGMGGVLLEVTAASDSSKQVLHVQSISCWAPCCIGPYSQVGLCIPPFSSKVCTKTCTLSCKFGTLPMHLN